jgi:predicted deacetylase
MKVNISIDDVSPHPKSSIKCLRGCHEMIDIFPSIKFTLFVPTAYTRAKEKTYLLTDYPTFCKEIRELSKDHFEIGYHGHFHGMNKNSSNGEFKEISYEKALEKLNSSKKVFNECGIEVQPIFRPPAFYLGKEAYRACIDFGIQNISLYPKYGFDGPKNSEKTSYIDCHPRCRLDKNWTNPPYQTLTKLDSLGLMYHACEWDKNYFSKVMKKELIRFLKQSKVDFYFFEEFHGKK